MKSSMIGFSPNQFFALTGIAVLTQLSGCMSLAMHGLANQCPPYTPRPYPGVMTDIGLLRFPFTSEFRNGPCITAERGQINCKRIKPSSKERRDIMLITPLFLVDIPASFVVDTLFLKSDIDFLRRECKKDKTAVL